MAVAILSSALSLVHRLGISISSSWSASASPLVDLDELEETKHRIECLAADMAAAAAAAQGDEAERRWLVQLRGVAYDAEELLDDCRIQLLSLSNAGNRDQMPQEEVRESTQLSFQEKTAIKIKSIRDRLHEIESQLELLHLESVDAHLVPNAETQLQPPLLRNVNESIVFGRDDDRKKLIELLLSNHRSILSVIPIVGPVGIGKTTLAHQTYDDITIRDHFDVRGWVSVPEDFDLVRLLSAIVLSIEKSDFIHLELEDLQRMVTTRMKGKRFLLVLDNVQNENESLWDSLRALLSVGLEGSAIIVTTRIESAARIMQTVPFYNLMPLLEEDCQLLFDHHAFGGQCPCDNLSLVKIGKRLVKKFKGVPLAAVMVGKLLHDEKFEENWHTISLSEFWKSSGVDSVVSSALKLSYYGLPKCLRVCFTYIALFPKGYLFKKEQLVQLWMAQGFIQPIKGMLLEDVGAQYFDELLRRSFFQKLMTSEHKFTVHHLIHDLVQSIASKEICTIIMNEDLGCASSEARHISVCLELCLQEFRSFIHSSNRPTNLRTLLIFDRTLGTCDADFLSSGSRLRLGISHDLLLKLKFLRTLELSGIAVEKLPDAIGNLTHLRYLGLRQAKIRSLPESLCSLYNMQTIDLAHCDNLFQLPKGIINLTNLRHLYLPVFGFRVPIPQGIGNLTNLQTLSIFLIRTGEGSVMEELKNLVNLRGELRISGLEHVSNVDYASDALKDKEHIVKLILSSGINNESSTEVTELGFCLFDGNNEDAQYLHLSSNKPNLDYEHHSSQNTFADGDDRVTAKDEISFPNEVCDTVEKIIFDRLRPHTNLKELVINSYCSLKFPDWVCDTSFSNLVSVELAYCSKCEALPALGQLPSLKHIFINELSHLKHIGQEFCGADATVSTNGFPSLETLYFSNMYELQEWRYVEDGSFPCLRHLELRGCRELRRIPHLFPSLVKLVIASCPNLIGLPMLPSLTRLELIECNEMIWTSTPNDLISRLEYLELMYFEDLSSLPLEHLSAIRELHISCCQQKTSHVAFLESQLCHLIFLKHLKISWSPGIWFSTNQELPSSLKILEILRCPLLKEWCQRHGSGKLVDISRVVIDHEDFHPVTADESDQAGQGGYLDSEVYKSQSQVN